MKEIILSATEGYKNGVRVYTFYHVDGDEPERTIPELIKRLRVENSELISVDNEYVTNNGVNGEQGPLIVMSGPGEASLYRPFASSELELFVSELSKSYD